MVRNQVLFLSLLVVFISSVEANVVVPRPCGGQLFVEGNVVIDFPANKGCVWEIQTDNDHILAFTVIDGSFEQVQNFVSIHDGLQEDSPVLLLENQKTLEFSKKDLPPTVYSSKSVATILLKEMTTSPLKLKIQRAVNCPFNLGSESSCGRAVDEISCYCATFTKRSQPDQKKYCTDNRMLLLSLESSEEENAVVWAWGASDRFWTSLSDEESEGTWIWQTTMQLPTGYTNWYPGQPDNGGAFYNEHCMTINNPTGWGDTQCKDSWDAICESH